MILCVVAEHQIIGAEDASVVAVVSTTAMNISFLDLYGFLVRLSHEIVLAW